MSALCARELHNKAPRPGWTAPAWLVLLICGSSADRLFLFILPHRALTCVNLPFTATKGDPILLLHAWITHSPQPRCLFQNLWRLGQRQMGAWGKPEAIYLLSSWKSLSLNNSKLTDNRGWWISRGIWKVLQWGLQQSMSFSCSSSHDLLKAHLREKYLFFFLLEQMWGYGYKYNSEIF